MIHETQREVDLQKTQNTCRRGKVGVEPHKTLKPAFEDCVYKVTGFGEKAELQVCRILLSVRIYIGALSKYG